MKLSTLHPNYNTVWSELPSKQIHSSKVVHIEIERWGRHFWLQIIDITKLFFGIHVCSAVQKTGQNYSFICHSCVPLNITSVKRNNSSWCHVQHCFYIETAVKHMFKCVCVVLQKCSVHWGMYVQWAFVAAESSYYCYAHTRFNPMQVMATM